MTTEIKYQSTYCPFDGTLDEQGIHAAMHAGGLLLCRSSLLANDWKRRLLSMDAKQLGSVQPTPRVLTWQAWLNSLLMQADSLPLPLSEQQEAYLWLSVIEQDLRSKNIDVRAARGLAGHAAAAYAALRDYRIDAAELLGVNEESEALHRWLQGVQGRLKDPRLTGRCLMADLPVAVMGAISTLHLPAAILLDCSETFTPMQVQLLDAVRRNNCSVRWLQPGHRPGHVSLTACADPMEETLWAADQVAKRLAANACERIGIVCADIREQGKALARELDKQLLQAEDNACDINSGQQRAAKVHGEPLSRAPMIHQLLHVLSLIGRPDIAFADFSPLLFMPWLYGFEQERNDRAAFDVKLRRQNRHRLTLTGLLKSTATEHMPGLRRVLQALSDWSLKARSARAWVQDMQSLLQAIGFIQISRPDLPGDVSQRPDFDIRQMNELKDVLAGMVAFDGVTDRMKWERFFSLLQDACSRTRLQTPCRFPNVQILPLEQVRGLRFDYLIGLGLDEDVLPSVPRPLAFIPSALQKKYGLPNCDGASAYEDAVALSTALRFAASEVALGFARQKQGRDVAASPMLSDMNGEAVHEYQPPEVADFAPDRMLQIFDDAQPVPLDTQKPLQGGTAIIRDQSACPFRAFATHRLNIAPLDETTPGIDPARKGSLMHLALEYIWTRLKSRSSLESLTEKQRSDLIEAAVSHAWKDYRVPVDVQSRRYEQTRMQRVLSEWLDIELQRPDFWVLETEQKYCLHLPESADNHFVVRIKADRLDQDASGHRILIDYKTGARQSPAKWLGERIEEPQLPQYAMAAGLGEDDAVSFARLRSGNMGFEGLSGEDTGIEGIMPCNGKRHAPDDWQQVLRDWRSGINALAQEFTDGRCDVSPRNAHACRYCGLEAVCRIDETGFDTTEDSEDEA